MNAWLRRRLARAAGVGRDERGTEVLEFALVFPVFAFLVLGLIFTLLAANSYVSLTHAALQGVRFASIPTDPIAGTYPTNAQVAANVASSSPFYYSAGCTTTTTGGAAENQPVSVSITCSYFNPIGTVISGLGGIIAKGTGASASSATTAGGRMTISVTATARSE